MVDGGALGFDDNSAVLCYWTPANHNRHEAGCWVCWATWRNGWIQACIGWIFSRTEFVGCSGKLLMTRNCRYCTFLKIILPWMVPLLVLWPCTKMNDRRSFTTATSDIQVVILKLLFCQTVKVNCVLFLMLGINFCFCVAFVLRVSCFNAPQTLNGLGSLCPSIYFRAIFCISNRPGVSTNLPVYNAKLEKESFNKASLKQIYLDN